MNHFDRTYFVDVRAYLLVIYALAEPHMIDKIDEYTKAVASYAAETELAAAVPVKCFVPAFKSIKSAIVYYMIKWLSRIISGPINEWRLVSEPATRMPE